MSVEKVCEHYALTLSKEKDGVYLNKNTEQEVNCHELLQDLQDKILIVSDTIRKERKEDGFTYKIAFLYCILPNTSSDECILKWFDLAKAEFGDAFIMAVENTEDTFHGISTIYGEEERGMY